MKAFFAAISRYFSTTHHTTKTPDKTSERPMLEPLESRQFLSVTMAGANDACTDSNSAIEAAATTPSVSPAIGKWKGTVQTDLRPRPFKAMINIQSVTPAGKIKGVASVPFLVDNYKFDINTRKSTMNPDGSFVVRFNKLGVSGTFNGHYDDTTKHVVGDFNGAGAGRTVTGTFDFARL